MKKYQVNTDSEYNIFIDEVIRIINKNSVVAMHGNLGAGKTYFVQNLLCKLGVQDIVNSPSFVIMNHYKGNNNKWGEFPVHHLDLYRLNDPEEVLELGLDEIFDEGLCLIEWPDLAEFILPDQTVHIRFSAEADNREIIIE